MAKGEKAKEEKAKGKVRAVGSKRDLENLLFTHGDKERYTVRVKSLHGLQSARVMQRALRRQILEKKWIVKGMDHLDALVDLHYMIANSASLLDEVISRVDAHLLVGHTPATAYEHPGAILDDPSTSTGQGSAHLIPGDNSASGYQGSAERNPAVLPDDGESTSTRHDSAQQKYLILGDNSASGYQGSAERNAAVLPDDASTSTRRQDSAQGKYLVLGDKPASGNQDSGERKPAVLPDDASTSTRRQDSAQSKYLVLGDNPASGNHDSGERRPADLPGGASTWTRRQDSAQSKYLVLGDHSASGYQDSTKPAIFPNGESTSRHQAYAESERKAIPFFLGGANNNNRERAALLFDRNSSVVGAANDRERVTLPFDGYPSLGRRAADHEPAKITFEPPSSALLGANDRLPANRATRGVQGGARGEGPDNDNVRVDGAGSSSYSVAADTGSIAEGSLGASVNPTLFASAPIEPVPDCCYNLDLATHWLFVSGTTFRNHHMASSSIQLIVQGLGRQIEEVAYALQDARHPPEVLLEDLRRVKLLLHEVWALRIPYSDFKLL